MMTLCAFPAGRLKKEKRETDKLLKSQIEKIQTLQERCERLQEENRQLLLSDDCHDSAIGSLGDLSSSSGLVNELSQNSKQSEYDYIPRLVVQTQYEVE